MRPWAGVSGALGALTTTSLIFMSGGLLVLVFSCLEKDTFYWRPEVYGPRRLGIFERESAEPSFEWMTLPLKLEAP